MPTDIPAPITETAPAKVNLTLHVTGRRADGYHLLDSLVVFAGVGDRLHLSPAPALSLALEGPFAAGIPAGADNLVLRAAAGLARRRAAEGSPGAHRPTAERAAPDAASDVPGGATGGASGWGPHPAGPPPTAADPAAGCPPGDAPDNGRIGGPNDRPGCGPNGGPTPGDAGAAGIGAAIVLEKNLPPASGLGGGSSDAAAALRGLARLWGCPPPRPAEGLALGADVPVCLAGVPVRMAGIGEDLSPCPPLPPAWLVLVNPGVETPTRAVFDALARRDNPAMPATLPAWPDAAALAAWLADQRNDLEAPARALFPVIDAVLAAIGARPGCLLARMSGSGATCFGIFADAAGAARAAAALRAGHPGWWVADAPLQPG